MLEIYNFRVRWLFSLNYSWTTIDEEWEFFQEHFNWQLVKFRSDGYVVF